MQGWDGVCKEGEGACKGVGVCKSTGRGVQEGKEACKSGRARAWRGRWCVKEGSGCAKRGRKRVRVGGACKSGGVQGGRGLCTRAVGGERGNGGGGALRLLFVHARV